MSPDLEKVKDFMKRAQAICKNCEDYSTADHICKRCGCCYIKVSVFNDRIEFSKCPLGKW